MLEKLRRQYLDVADYLQREHPEVQTVVMDATSAGGVDEVLRDVMQRIGIEDDGAHR